ncbi:MAG: T9SS type A sorting domain-containing protein [Crocinitomicaceae bacterium]|nr:T9SS type A sorting domain-containing protein [Crocinitomicaceae bacterium]
MKKLFTFLSACFVFSLAAQTTVYTTGQTYADAWTGWSTPVVTNISSSSVNGANIYSFNGTTGQAYTIETYRQFTINSDDIDFWLGATTETCLVSIEISLDNISYTQVGSQNWGAGFSTSTLIVPTVDPGGTTFYVKLKMAGTFGSPSQANFNNLKIDAVLNSTNAVSVAPIAVQNINVGANGTMLSATESPSAATSREWKYSTTSGSGYVSFGTAQTGTTYTPNFAAAGTYYVVCISDFSGDIQTSNEVQINVGSAGLTETTLTCDAYFNYDNLLVYCSLNNYNVTVYDLSGKVIFTGVDTKTADFSAMENGIYFVRIEGAGISRSLKIAKTN